VRLPNRHAAPVFNVANTVITTDSITLRWSPGSAFTVSYLVYGRRAINSRDLAAGSYTLLQTGPATSCAVTNLASGTFYTFRVHAITAAGIDSNQAEFTFQTAAIAGGAGTLPPGGTPALPPCTHARVGTGTDMARWRRISPVIGVQTGIIAGVAVAVIVIVAALIVGFFVYKQRMVEQQRKLLADYNSQLTLLTMQRGAGALHQSGPSFADLSSTQLRANLQVPKTQFSGADATLLNTVMEVSLPGFLLLDYSNDLRADARLTAGGAGTIFRGVVLHPDAVKRNGGGEVVAIKQVCGPVYACM
jgi:hypothetical protein